MSGKLATIAITEELLAKICWTPQKKAAIERAAEPIINAEHLTYKPDKEFTPV
jgi:hypothetical protein